mmetsp:Transcript_1952/g.7007  ORF Transcript_1952/g.7007 Transcript_1952/m.7007 type:complete len:383 (-) Transcript_1952:410-1558(-)
MHSLPFYCCPISLPQTTRFCVHTSIVSLSPPKQPGADLVGALAPTFSLKPYSFLEWVSELLQPKDFLLKAPKISNPEKRMLSILKYICEAVSTMPQQGVQQVKGYNSILGETFECSWEHETSTTTFFGEQVSHHPPISACYIENKTCGLQIEIVFQPKVRFHGSLSGPSVQSHIEGAIFIHLVPIKEHYEVRLPHFVCRNLLFGGSYCELNDDLTITCSNGLKSTVNFRSKSKNKCTGQLVRPTHNRDEVLYKIEGVSNQKLTVHHKDKPSLLMNAASIKTTKKNVKPVAEQTEIESRRVWHAVTKSIFEKNLDQATKYKTLIEDAERVLRKQRDSRGEKWTPTHFETVKKNGKEIPLGNSTLYYRYKKFDHFHESVEKKDE